MFQSAAPATAYRGSWRRRIMECLARDAARAPNVQVAGTRSRHLRLCTSEATAIDDQPASCAISTQGVHLLHEAFQEISAIVRGGAGDGAAFLQTLGESQELLRDALLEICAYDRRRILDVSFF